VSDAYLRQIHEPSRKGIISHNGLRRVKKIEGTEKAKDSSRGGPKNGSPVRGGRVLQKSGTQEPRKGKNPRGTEGTLGKGLRRIFTSSMPRGGGVNYATRERKKMKRSHQGRIGKALGGSAEGSGEKTQKQRHLPSQRHHRTGSM